MNYLLIENQGKKVKFQVKDGNVFKTFNLHIHVVHQFSLETSVAIMKKETKTKNFASGIHYETLSGTNRILLIKLIF